MQSLMTEMLKSFGVGDIMTCENAKEAIDLLTITQARSQSRYIMSVDIVLTDWLMPKGSGRELVEWIRAHKEDSVRFLPVVVISGFTTGVMTAQTRDSGANEALVKPISGNGLASRICAVIDNPRPFVEAPTYFGPDRRRQEMVFNGGERRVMSANQIEVKP